MSITHPKISVVCPTWNSAVFIRDTLASVLQQTSPPFELIISDDGSGDDTIEIVERMTQEQNTSVVRILRNTHKGPGAARNAGIRVAKGDWIAFLDSDDRWKADKVAQVLKAITEHPAVNFFCHDVYHRFLDGSEERLNLAARYHLDIPLTRQLFSCSYFFATSSIVCRRDILLEHGMFSEMLPTAQDFELWLRLSPFLRVYVIPEVLGFYIDRPGNISSGKRWRHLRIALQSLFANRKNARFRWYVIGIARLVAVFCKNQLITSKGKR